MAAKECVARTRPITKSTLREARIVTATNSTKVCTKCKRTLPRSEFHRAVLTRDGLRGHCKDCRRIWIRDWKRKKRAEGDLEWLKKEHRDERKWASGPAGEKYRTANKDKLKAQERARSAVRRAVRDGKMPRIETLKCKTCGGQAAEYHHHLGYTKKHRLHVQPFCRTCHKAAHAEMKLAIEQRKDTEQ